MSKRSWLAPALLALPAVVSAQIVSLPGNQAGHRTPAVPQVRAATKLVNSPSAMTVTQIGSVQQLRVFLETAFTQTEVTTDPGTSYSSSNSAIVSVSASGLMTFAASGQAQISAHHSGLSAITLVDVDPSGKVMVEAPIGPAGGSVHAADGTGLDVPPGSLSQAQTIRLEAVDLPPSAVAPHGGALVGSAYDLTPSGLTFSKDVQLALAYDPGSLPSGFDPATTYVAILRPNGTLAPEIVAGPDGAELLVETPTLAVDDPAGDRILMPIRHFSERTLVIGKNAVPDFLTAPDGTTLPILRLLKTGLPGKGADNRYGVANCDDDGDGQVDNASEFEGAGGLCAGPIDDVAVAPTTRLLSSIQHIVLHSTASPANQSFARLVEVTAQTSCRYWAQYYVGREGTIVQVSGDDIEAQHVVGNGTVSNANSIGIEIFHQVPDENYSGRQLAAVVQLCDHLLKTHAGIVRPSATDSDGNLVTHSAQDTAVPKRKFDPEQNFREPTFVQSIATGNITHGMGAPSLEQVVMRALRTDTPDLERGLVHAGGGDALSTGIPGSGGFVRIEYGDASLENTIDDARTNQQIDTGATAALTAGNQMSVLVDGTATVTSSLSLDLDGILWVGPNGVIDARGGFDGQDGHSLTFTSDGFALIEGRVLVNGADKLGASEVAPFNQPPFNGGSGAGNGGNAGGFTFRTAAGGIMRIPTIVARGGDADSCPTGIPMPGGNGGDVVVRGDVNSAGDTILTLVTGRANVESADQVQTGMPDYLPPPAPFNLMPVVLNPPTLTSGTCAVDPFSNPNYVRPVSNERLPLGRAVTAANHQAGASISTFERGIWTSGGMGGNPPSTATLAGDGGAGGSILIENLTDGYVRFLDDVQLFAGAGADRVASVISVAACGGSNINKFFHTPSGSLGGRGAFLSGDGGVGGNAGDITVSGRLWPNINSVVVPTGTSMSSILGFDLDNPTSSGGHVIGHFVIFPAEGFTTTSTRGSGGSPGGQASGFPGTCGLSGSHGTTIVNGAQFYP